MERIIQSSSNEGDLVLDPFCGCGTTVAVAERLGRQWIGIDITHLAVNLMRVRLRDSSPDAEFRVVGEPADLAGAKALADEDKFQFQWWALGLVGARPANERKGADQGIDGRLFFRVGGKKGTSHQEIVFSVKGGKVSVRDVRDLWGVIEREDAAIGVLIAMESMTRPMRREAASAGFYDSSWGKHPRIQLLTVADLLAGKELDYPKAAGVNVTYKQAPKLKKAAEPHPELFKILRRPPE